MLFIKTKDNFLHAGIGDLSQFCCPLSEFRITSSHIICLSNLLLMSIPDDG